MHVTVCLESRAYTSGWKNILTTLFAIIKPYQLRFDTDASIESLLGCVHAGQIKSLYIGYGWPDPSKESEMAWLAMFRKASPTLEVLAVEGCLMTELTLEEYQEHVPFCPSLRKIRALTGIDKLVPLEEREMKSTDLYEVIISKHADQVTELDLTPFQFARNARLSEVAKLPRLETLTLHYILPTEIDEDEEEEEDEGEEEDSSAPWLYSVLEFDQLEDLANFPSIRKLIFEGRGHPLQHKRLLWALHRLLNVPTWLPNLKDVSIDEIRVSCSDPDEADSLLGAAVQDHMDAFGAFLEVCDSRKIHLTGDFPYLRSCYSNSCY